MTAAIIQARMGSFRFPGKMNETLGGHTILEWVIYRVKKSRLTDKIILATTLNRKDEIFFSFKKKYNIEIFCGSENNVLDRFYKAALKHKVDNIIRICADNPFIDHIQIDDLINFYNNSNCDYCSNNQDYMNSGYPDGFGAEILSFNALKKIKKEALKDTYKEHLTSYIKENPEKFRINVMRAKGNLNYPNLRFDVDTLEDLKKMKFLINNGVSINSSALEILNIFKNIKIKN